MTTPTPTPNNSPPPLPKPNVQPTAITEVMAQRLEDVKNILLRMEKLLQSPKIPAAAKGDKTSDTAVGWLKLIHAQMKGTLNNKSMVGALQSLGGSIRTLFGKFSTKDENGKTKEHSIPNMVSDLFGKISGGRIGRVLGRATSGVGNAVKSIGSHLGNSAIGRGIGKAVSKIPGVSRAVGSAAGGAGRLMAGGSARLLAGAARAGPYVAAAAAIAIVGYELAMLPKTIRNFANSMLQSQQHLEEYSGGMAEVFGKKEVADTLRNMKMGNETSESAGVLQDSLERLEDMLQPVEAWFQNGANQVIAVAVEFAISLLDKLIDIGNVVIDGINALIPGADVLKRIEKNTRPGDGGETPLGRMILAWGEASPAIRPGVARGAP